MNAKLVGKTIQKIDSKIGAANRELKAGAADDERAQLLANECAGLVALAAQYGAVYVTDFASGGGALERKNWQLPAAAGRRLADTDDSFSSAPRGIHTRHSKTEQNRTDKSSKTGKTYKNRQSPICRTSS